MSSTIDQAVIDLIAAEVAKQLAERQTVEARLAELQREVAELTRVIKEREFGEWLRRLPPMPPYAPPYVPWWNPPVITWGGNSG